MRLSILLIALLIATTGCTKTNSEPPIAGKLKVTIHVAPDRAFIANNRFAWNRWPALAIDLSAPKSDIHLHRYYTTSDRGKDFDITQELPQIVHTGDPITFSVGDHLCWIPRMTSTAETCNYFKDGETTIQPGTTTVTSGPTTPVTATITTTFIPLDS